MLEILLHLNRNKKYKERGPVAVVGVYNKKGCNSNRRHQDCISTIKRKYFPSPESRGIVRIKSLVNANTRRQGGREGGQCYQMPNVTLIAMIAGILLMSYISQQRLQMFAGKISSHNFSLTIHLQSPITWQLN